MITRQSPQGSAAHARFRAVGRRHCVCAAWPSPRGRTSHRFDPGVLLVSPVHDNIQQPHALLEQIRVAACPPTAIASAARPLILPDYCARVAVLDFDTFPTDPDEQQALVRFRLKKSVPFDVDTAMVSYVQQPRSSNGRLRPRWKCWRP